MGQSILLFYKLKSIDCLMVAQNNTGEPIMGLAKALMWKQKWSRLIGSHSNIKTNDFCFNKQSKASGFKQRFHNLLILCFKILSPSLPFKYSRENIIYIWIYITSFFVQPISINHEGNILQLSKEMRIGTETGAHRNGCMSISWEETKKTGKENKKLSMDRCCGRNR